MPRASRKRVLPSACVLKQAAGDHIPGLLPHNLHHAVGVTMWHYNAASDGSSGCVQ